MEKLDILQAIRILLLLVALGLGPSLGAKVPSRFEIETSINRTVNEVERLMRENPTLPKLSRKEIVRILQNITSNDINSLKDEESVHKARSEYQRALMVVLPHNVKDSNENLDDLYTKAPFVQMIPDSLSTEAPKRYEGNVWQRNKTESRKPKPFVVPLKTSTSTTSSRPENHRDSYADAPSSSSANQLPEKFSFNLNQFERSKVRPVYQHRETTSTTLEPVSSTSLATKTQSSSSRPINDQEPSDNIVMVKKLASSVRVSAEEPTKEVEAPTRISLIPMDADRPSPIFVTPLSSSSSLKASPESVYNIASGGFLTATTTTTSTSTSTSTSSNSKTPVTTPMRQEVEDLLASIGLKAKDEENFVHHSTPDTSSSNSFTAATQQDSATSSIGSQNTFEGPTQDIRKGVNNLTRDVQLLFQRFGLQTSEEQKQKQKQSEATSKRPVKVTLGPDSYTNFKPLPDSSVANKDMKDFLAKFGLGVSENRAQKAMKSQNKPSLIEAVPENMKTILENIGLISKSARVPATTIGSINSITSTATPHGHIFKPHESPVDDREQRRKINELLQTVRRVQEGKADAFDVQRVANDLLRVTKSLPNGPDPLQLAEILRIYQEDVKNEVKRQQQQEEEQRTSLLSAATTETIGSTETETTAATTTSTTEPSSSSVKSVFDLYEIPDFNATGNDTTTTTTESTNLKDLADSFGGTTSAPDPVLPTKRRSGLYFLLDWNSFLEVGEEGKDKVNLRFQPKVGDRTRFIPVVIP